MKILIFQGPGVYVPIMVGGTFFWAKDETGNPLVGVQVDSTESAAKFSRVIPPLKGRVA